MSFSVGVPERSAPDADTQLQPGKNDGGPLIVMPPVWALEISAPDAP